MKVLWAGASLILATLPAVAVNTSSDYRALPAVLSGAGTPIVMLAMSQDHQLFYKAYTDWDDLDNDPLSQPETSYEHSIEYYGYFDSDKCYVYDASQEIFRPDALTADRYCTGTGQWAGNFLNWGSTARIDAVRKILYGGSRVARRANGEWVLEHQWPDAVSALPTATVLERTYLPNDAHSFAKYYAGRDLGGGVNDISRLTPFSPPLSGDSDQVGITLCNTTRDTSGFSQNSTAPPRIAMARGNHSLWNANERWQCLWSNEQSASNGNDPALSGIDASASSPSLADHSSNADYTARVEVCVAGLIGSERCKQYPDGSLKPVGLLQEYGDDDRVWFGLMTGSYRANKSGGVLRKNPGSLSDEVDTGGSGRFLPSPSAGHIITAIDSMRPYGYAYSNGIYNSGDNCSWGRNAFDNDQCRNWGNPLSEIVLECYRYLAGASPTSGFAAEDALLPNLDADSPLRDLISASWQDPLTEANSCAKLNVIAFNASTSSYDTDELSGVVDLNTAQSADQLTDRVGAGEGLHGQSAFVGRVDQDTNELCTPKTIDALSEVQGTCPDAPRLAGGYQIAGLAHHVSQVDVRPPQSPTQDDYPGDQSITTYGVALTPTLPKVRIPVPGSSPQRFVTLLPACFNSDVGGNCGLVDFRVTELYSETNGVGTGAFYVNWEDSEQGGDYDQDMSGILSYSIDANSIDVTTQPFAQSTGYDMGFGFVISGTTQDGFHAYTGINGFTWSNSTGAPGCSNCQVNGSQSHRFTLGDASASLLQQPLYYAAKWGGFADSDGDGTPNLVPEWDRKDNSTGAFAPDGIPDNYFLAIDPGQLRAQLGLVLEDIINRTAAGTGGAVVANSVSGLGAVYQALYQPQYKSGDRSVEWVGLVHALFIDDNGYLREDNDQDGQLDGYSVDYVVDVSYEPLSDTTLVTRFTSTDGGQTIQPVGDPVPLSELKPIWNARDALARVSAPELQRSYASDASTRRHILTAAGPGTDGKITQQDVVNFSPATFQDDLAMRRALNVPSGVGRDALVQWVRGQEQAGLRSRTVDFLSDLDQEVWRLGDVIHSTPTPVGAPNAGYDAIYGDTSYLAFKSQYADRRTVVYVGANDGMLHAFNGGFWNESARSFDLSPTSGRTVTTHPLGSELWAYVPFNLLPHLKWLVEEDYPHVYYVDGRPKVFDARVFDDTDPDHPGGWGTVLAVTLRMGGGAYFVDWDGVSGNGPGGTDAEMRMRSTLLLFDVTDPESAPELMLELSDDQLGDFFFTTPNPSVMQHHTPGSQVDWSTPASNQWHLVFGTGPDNLNSGTRASNAGVYVLDLASLNFLSGFAPKPISDVPAGFIGDMASVDWTQDGVSDAAYFGVVAGDARASSGGLKRLVQSGPGQFALTLMMPVAVGQPITAAPSMTTDGSGQRWVHVGTGRLLVSADNQSTEAQAFYGLRESSALDTVISEWVEVGGVDRATDGTLTPASYAVDGDSVTTVDQLNEKIAQKGAWRRAMTFDGTAPSGRVVEPAVVLEDLVLFTEYSPDGLLCQPSGFSRLFGLDLANGVRRMDSGLALVDDSGETQLLTSVSIGSGLAFSPLIHSSTGEFGGDQVIVADDKGGYTFQSILLPSVPGGRESWRQVEW